MHFFFLLTWAWTYLFVNIKIVSRNLLEGALSSFHVNKKLKRQGMISCVQTFQQNFIHEETFIQEKTDSKDVAKRLIQTQAVRLEKEF